MKKLVSLLMVLLLVVLLTACGGNRLPVDKPSDVRNDTTGTWKKARTSENVDILDYAKDYADKYMKNGDTHFIINFTNNTTSVLNLIDGNLFIDIRERVDREEHDAKTIGSGMTLKEYIIYPDGTVEEIK